MTDSTLNRFLASGTNAERTAFTPSPPTPGSGPDPTYFWLETDTGNSYAWDFDGAAWDQVNSGLADGDYGDVTVSSSGAVWTVDNGAITYAKMQDVSATSRLLGRYTSGAGDVEEIALGAHFSVSGGTLQRAFRGALVKKSADQTAADYTSASFIAWNAETYDTDSIHDNATNNSRLTVPAGVTHVRLAATVTIALLLSNLFVALVIKKNGSGLFDGRPAQFTEVSSTTPAISAAGPVLAVSPGDYFEVELVVETDTSITITAAQSWFAMEIVA